MGLLNLNELTGNYPMYNGRPVGWRTDKSFEVPRRAIMSGGLRGLGKGAGAALAQMYQDGVKKLASVKPQAEGAVAKLVEGKRMLDNLASQARSLASGAGGDAIDYADRVAGYADKVNASIRRVREAVASAVGEVERTKSQAGTGGVLFGPDSVVPLEQARDMAVSALAEVEGYAEEAQNAIKQIRIVAAESGRQAEAARREAEAERLRQEAEDRRRALEEEKVRREQERLDKMEADRAAREEAARLRQEQLEQAAVEAQRAREERAQALEEARIARQEEAARRAEETELRRQEAMVSAEERKYAMEQERILREEQAQLRREEREAELQKLMAMQELAAKGLPVPGAQPDYAAMFAPGMPGMYPPGYPAVPGVPGAGFPTYPGTQPGVMAPMYPGAVPAGFAPPGMAIPGPAGAPPGYAAMPPAFAQSQGMQPSGQAAAPPGFQWAAFDPSAEMFGMGGFGDLKPTLNPTLQGGLIEEGYSIIGPDANSNYALTDPNNRTVGVFSEDRIYAGEIRHGSKVVFVPPQEARPRAPSTGLTVAQEIADVLKSAAQPVADVLKAREERKAAKYRPVGPVYDMPLSTGSAPPQVPGYVWLIGALGLGAFAFWAVGKKKPEGGKAA